MPPCCQDNPRSCHRNWRTSLGRRACGLRPTRERAHDTDVLAPETKFARAPDGVHIAWACSRVGRARPVGAEALLVHADTDGGAVRHADLQPAQAQPQLL
jgi:hypothetical protein